MKKLTFGILIILVICSMGSIKIMAQNYEKDDENYEKEISEKNAELERFVGLPKDIVWQIYCTELWQILKEDTKDFDERYISSYEEEIGYTQSFSQRIQRASDSAIKRHEDTWSSGIKEGVKVEETRYYRLQKALVYYLQMQITIGDPIIFNYTEHEQSLFNEDAKKGIKPDIEDLKNINEEKNNVEDLKGNESNLQKKKIINKKEQFTSFLLGGGITLIVTIILGIILFIQYLKKRKKQFE